MGFAQAPAFAYVNMRLPLICPSKRKLSVSAMKLNGDDDPLLLAATASASASLRYQETLRPGKSNRTHLSLF